MRARGATEQGPEGSYCLQRWTTIYLPDAATIYSTPCSDSAVLPSSCFLSKPSSLQEPTTANRSRNFKIPDCTLTLPTGGKGQLEHSMVGSLWLSLQDLFCPLSPPQLASQGCPIYHTEEKKKKETHTKFQGGVTWAVMSLSQPLFTDRGPAHAQGTSRLGQATCMAFSSQKNSLLRRTSQRGQCLTPAG